MPPIPYYEQRLHDAISPVLDKTLLLYNDWMKIRRELTWLRRFFLANKDKVPFRNYNKEE